jgi:hypothetical protein
MLGEPLTGEGISVVKADSGLSSAAGTRRTMPLSQFWSIQSAGTA